MVTANRSGRYNAVCNVLVLSVRCKRVEKKNCPVTCELSKCYVGSGLRLPIKFVSPPSFPPWRPDTNLSYPHQWIRESRRGRVATHSGEVWSGCYRPNTPQCQQLQAPS